MIKNEIEYAFEQFMKSVPPLSEYQDIDSVGINLNKDNVSFKAYIGMRPENFCKDTFLNLSPSGLLKSLTEKNMIYLLETIQDTRKNWFGRYDIALDNRTNDNMEWLFQQLKMKVPFIAEYEMQLLKMSSMKISERPDYKLAALYHIGVLEKDDGIQALKFYFTARHQNIPKYHSKNFEYHDEEYLDFWGNCGLDNFSRLRDMAQDMRAYCGGHVWIAGLDISKKGISKCKIYLKKMSNVYEYLKTVSDGIYCDTIEQLEVWHYKNPQFIFMGLAIGLDKTDKLSLNLYYAI